MSSERFNKMFPISWDQLHRDAKALAWRLSSVGPFEKLAVVTRGGMVPGAIIARELDLRFIDTLCIASYDWQSQGKENVLKSIDGDGEGWLVIDDLVDTGTTAKVVRRLLPKAHFACLYAKPEGRDTVDTFVTEVSQDTWILFPWDSEVQYVQPIVNRVKKD